MQSDSRLAVLVERHLLSELELLDQLHNLNDLLSQGLNQSGVRGVTLEQANELAVATENLATAANLVRSKRNLVLEKIGSAKSFQDRKPSIRKYIQSLDASSASRLESLRQKLLDRMTDIHASLLGNQAVLFYSHDFYKNIVNGLLDIDPDKQNYGEDGQRSSTGSGILIRKAC